MATSLTVAVGSRNPVKVTAVRSSFERAFPDTLIDVTMHDVPSGVPDQPWGDEETRAGALNRATACHAAHTDECGTPPDFAVGLEGGVLEENFSALHPGTPGLFTTVSCFAVMAIMGTSSSPNVPPRWGIAKTASFPLPQKILTLMRGDPPMELGAADDAVFNEVNSKQKGGTVAKATKGMIDRTAYYEHALTCGARCIRVVAGARLTTAVFAFHQMCDSDLVAQRSPHSCTMTLSCML